MAEYTLRKLVEGSEASPRDTLDNTIAKLAGRLVRETEPNRKLIVDGAERRERKLILPLLDQLDASFKVKPAPNRIVVASTTGPRFAVKRFEPADPVTDTPGTKQIDRIYSAVHGKFDAQFLVRDMGICVDKPLEHGHCNAWDAGTNTNLSADQIHANILKMATFIRAQGILNDQDPTKGLPVFGVIVLDKYWKTGMGATWAKYTGQFHAVHFHVSGKPSFTGFI